MMSPTRAQADQRGFTLAELLVAIAIVGLIMTGLVTLLMTGNESYLAGANQVEAQAAVRAGLERMTQEIREAGYNPLGLPPCVPPLAPNVPAGAVPWTCMDPIVNATATTFTIWNDWNGTGCIQGAAGCTDGALPVPVPYIWGGVATNVNRGEQITYQIVGVAPNAALCRQESAVPAPPASPPCPAGFELLVTSVAQANLGGVQPFFQYLDGSGCAIGACNNPQTGAPSTQADIRTVIVNFQVGVQNTAPGIWRTGAIQVTMSDRIRLRNRIP
jgi:prepilin-type N-terminal cleavage/methylation domain-containing protein